MRIVSLAPSNTEILYALGAGDDIVGVTTFCNYPPEAKAKQKVGGWVNVDYDSIKSLDPDIVITSTMVQERAAQTCREMGFNVLHLDPKNLSEVFDTVHRLGQLTGRQQQAELVAQMMRLKVDEIIAKTKDATSRPHVYAEEWHKPPFVCGNWIPELIDAAGGESLIKSGRSREVTLDEVRAFDPRYMIVTWCGFGENAQMELIKYREGWEDLYCVKNDKIFAMDDSYLNRPGPRVVEGLEMLAKIIHPELFK